MVFASLTRLRVGSIFYLPAFIRANEAAVKEIMQIPGFLGGAELTDKGLVFWTITYWQDETAMKSFRNCEAHCKAMQNLPDWCSEASYTHWTDDNMPKTIDWKLMHEKMIQDGKLTKVRRPSKRQLTKDYPQVKWSKLQRPLKGY